MESKFYIESDKKRDESGVYGDKIDRDKIRDNLEKYELVLYEKVKKLLCSE